MCVCVCVCVHACVHACDACMCTHVVIHVHDDRMYDSMETHCKYSFICDIHRIERMEVEHSLPLPVLSEPSNLLEEAHIRKVT